MRIHVLPTVHFFMLSYQYGGSMRGFDDPTKAIFDAIFDRIGVLWYTIWLFWLLSQLSI